LIEGVREQGAEENTGSKREEVAEGWRRLHNEEPHTLYSSQTSIRVTKLSMMT